MAPKKIIISLYRIIIIIVIIIIIIITIIIITPETEEIYSKLKKSVLIRWARLSARLS